MLPQDVSSERGPGGAIAQAWDPYDVWLKRVKQPRDRVPQRSAVLVAVATSRDAAPGTEPPVLVPHAT